MSTTDLTTPGSRDEPKNGDPLAAILALPEAQRGECLAALLAPLDGDRQRDILDASVAIEVWRPGARALAAVIPHIDPALRARARDLADALPGLLAQRLAGATTAELRAEVVRGLAFTGLPDGTDAERAVYLRAWQRPPESREEPFLAAAFGAEAFLRWGFAQDAHANESAQVALEYLVEDARLAARQAIWRLDNPRGAALAAEFRARWRRVEQLIDELARLETDDVVRRAAAIPDARERADVLHNLALRASGFRRKALSEATITAILAIADPLARCLPACRLIPLLPAGSDRKVVVQLALDGLRGMDPVTQPMAATSLAQALNDAERDQLLALAQALGDEALTGYGKASILAALIPHAAPPEGRALRAQVADIIAALPTNIPGPYGKSLREEAQDLLDQAQEQLPLRRSA